jgi:5'-3' exonuclease
VRRLVLIDAANCLYRAFFAPFPPLRTTDGTPTKAVYVFATMLRKLVREEQPDAIAVVMDPPGGSFRRELFAEYKGTREAQPEELTVQFPLARELAGAWRIPILEVEGFEADDVIATLVAKASPDTEVVIVSSDKDLMQLVGERVALLDTMKDRRIGPPEVEARFGVGPDQLLDVRALAGDSSDNIPGVKGIGEKGAAKLVQEFGTLEELLANAEKVKAKRAREALLEQPRVRPSPRGAQGRPRRLTGGGGHGSRRDGGRGRGGTREGDRHALRKPGGPLARGRPRSGRLGTGARRTRSGGCGGSRLLHPDRAAHSARAEGDVLRRCRGGPASAVGRPEAHTLAGTQYETGAVLVR